MMSTNSISRGIDECNFIKFFDAIKSLFFILDTDKNILYSNKTVEERLGYTNDELLGKSILFVHPEERREEAHQNLMEMLEHKRDFSRIPMIAKDGQEIPAATRVAPGEWEEQQVLFCISNDISEFQQIVEEKDHLTNMLFDQPLLGMFFMMLDEPVSWNDQTDKEQVMDYVIDHNRVTKVNQAMLALYSAREEDFLGLTLNQLKTNDIIEMKENFTRLFDEGHLKIETMHHRADGTPLYVEGDYICMYDKEGRIVGNFGTQSDVTDKVQVSFALTETRKTYEEKVHYLSQYDTLTGLLNHDALRKLISGEVRSDTDITAILHLDIDNFRIVNESLGHQAADTILYNLAGKIRSLIGNQGKIYRKDGDGFVVVLKQVKSSQVYQIAKGLLEATSRELLINQRRYYLTVSIGISFHEQNASLAQTLNQADAALYVAKKTKNTIVSFDASMDRMKTRETILYEDLNQALDQGEFELYYQPIVNLSDGSTGQAEALLRWNHPEFGIIAPAEFIPIAERTRMIIPLTNWVIRDCCERMGQWKVSGFQFLMISINLSLICIENRVKEFTDYLKRAVKDADIEPGGLKLEVTESVLMENKEEVLAAFQELRQDGFQLVMDDFGTGYSSFCQMKDLPINLLKLDRSLIVDIEHDKRGQMICQSMIEIAHNLGMEVVAEGIDTEGQLQKLKSFQCDYAQGFFLGKPKPADEFLASLKTQSSEHNAGRAMLS